MDFISKTSCLCCRKAVREKEQLFCLICFEEGKLRKCCKSVFCDHCYTKGKSCPKCKNATKKDKATGATFVIQAFSEHEECRICLDPGLKRKCCGRYYCDDCYYALKTCRGCGKIVTSRGGLQMDFKHRATYFSVFMGWAITVFLCLALCGAVAVITSSQLLTPEGLSGYQCFGFYSTCDLDVCVGIDDATAYGEQGTLTPLYTWRSCVLNDTVKLEARACIFDNALYLQTQGVLGYDVCRSHFEEGVYVFHEDFELWTNSTNFHSNQMKSAKWESMINAKVDGLCGTSAGDGALHFSGKYHRWAMTKPLDVSYGGRLDAKLFLSPLGFDQSHPFCKTSFQGSVTLQFTTDRGQHWTTLADYDSPRYRQEDFFPVSLELPRAAWTNRTQIRFIQFTFEEDRDGWAIDDIRVIHYLPSHWDRQSSFLVGIEQTKEYIQHAQCCFDTEWCETRYSTDQLSTCGDIKGFKKQTYIFHQIDIVIAVVALIGIAKFIYIAIQNWLMHRRFPFNDEVDDMFKFQWFLKLVPPRYRPRKNLKDLVSNVHESARAVRNLREALGDVPVREEASEKQMREAEENMQRREEEAARKKREKEKSRLRKNLKRKFKKHDKERKKKIAPELPAAAASHHDFTSVKVMDLEALDDDIVEAKEVHEHDVFETGPNGELKFSIGRKVGLGQIGGSEGGKYEFQETMLAKKALTSAEDDIKRRNLAMRMPFDVLSNIFWRTGFFIVTAGILVAVFLYKASTEKDYIIQQSVIAFGRFNGKITVTSGGVLFLALACDIKELYHVVRYVVPLAHSWVPLLTVDISEEISALFIGRNTIKLADITEAHIFSRFFIFGCALAYFVGVMPWCLATLTLRDQYLSYGYMRIVVPCLGGILALRAVLGPGVFLKSIFALQYVVDVRALSRQKIGSAFQTRRTILTAINTSLGVTIIGVFMCGALAADVAQYAFPILLVLGAIYGAFTGCLHSLPVRPWIVLSTLRSGVWFRVRKQQGCPCVYRGKFCSEVHQYDEMFVMFPREQLQFMSILKGVEDEIDL